MAKNLQEQKFGSSEIRDKFKELFENSLDLIYVHDLRGNFIDANDIALLSLGYKRDELHEISFKNLIDKEQLATVFDAIKEIKENGKQSRPSEYKLKTKNGDIKFVETYGIPLRKNGEIYGILGVAKDITARINANQKLEESEGRLRELNKKLEQLVNEITQESKRSEYNLQERVKELSCLYGLSKLSESQDFSIGDVIRGTLDLIPPAWRFPDNICVRIVFKGQEFKTENFIKTNWKQIAEIKEKGENVGTVEIYYLNEMLEFDEGPFLKEEWDLIIAIAEYLGRTFERKKVEDQIKHTYLELDQIFNLSVPMYVIDKNYEIIRVNGTFLSLFHLKREDMIDKKCWDVWKSPLCHTHECSMRQILDGKERYSYEIDKEVDDGTTVSCIVTSFPYFNPNGEIIGSIKSFTDITDRKKAEQKLKESEDHLKILNEELERKIYERTKKLSASEDRLIYAQRIARLGFWDLNIITGELYWSDETYRTFGFKPQEFEPSYEKFRSVIHPDDLEFVQKHVDAALQEDIKYNIDFRIVLPSSEIRYVDAQGEVTRDSNGKAIRFVGTQIDITERKKAEEKLRLNSEIMTNMAEGVYLIRTKDGIITYTNPKFEKMFGYKQGEMIGKNVSIVNAPTDKSSEVIAKEITEILERTGEWHGEVKNIKKDGTPFWCYANVSTFDHPKHGRVWVSVHADITERKKAEEKLKVSEEKYRSLSNELEQRIIERTKELKESEEKYRFLFETSPYSIFIMDKKGKVRDLNPSGENTFGYTKKELLGKRFMKFQWFLPETMPVILETFKTLVDGKIPELTELQQRKKDGTLIWVSILFSFVSVGEEELIQVIIQDISEIKEAEQKLKESEKKYRGIIENIKQGYFEVDLKGNFTFFNDALIEILGYDSDELMGMNYIYYVDEETAKEIFKVYNNVFKANSGQNTVEFEIIKKNREKVFVETSVYLKRDAEGHRIGFHGLVRDITEKKREATLREKFKEQLEKEVNLRTIELNYALEQQKLYLDQIIRASQFKTEFLATMSHELRTPLNAIIGFTDLLLEGAYGPLNEEQMDFLNDIKSSAEHQLDMIKNILDISKIESGQLHLNWQGFSLNIIIDQANATVKPLYNKKNLNFTVQGLDYERFIYADPIRFKEILLNLLSNAIKFTISGGITLIVQEDARNWIIKVRDTGIGIARKDFNIIFKEFKRVDSPFVESVPGTGLGLSLTKRLVDLHGGEITFSSKLGKGTTFTFTISKIKDKK